MELQLNTGDYHTVSAEDIAEYTKLYPAIDVVQEVRNMTGWLLANPTKRKTKRGITRFINSWLCRAQDKGGSSQFIKQPTQVNQIAVIDHWIGVDPDVSLASIAQYKLNQYGGFIYQGVTHTSIDTLPPEAVGL